MTRTGNTTHRRLLGVVVVLLIATIAGMVVLWPAADQLGSQDVQELEDLVAGEIQQVVIIEGEPDPTAGLSGELAQLRVLALDGPDEGEVLELEINTDGFPEIRVGDRVALDRTPGPDGEIQYFITDFQRLPTLALLVGLFILAVLVISRWHGLRSLIGLGLSLLIIVRFIVPAILAGNNPPVVALVGAVAVMIVTLYLTHGINEMTTAAVIGTSASLGLTVVLGLLFVDRGRITGFASDDAVFARFQIEGLDLQGLVLAGLIIAALGVLDDVTISQSSTVFAIHDTDRTLRFPALFARAMRVGRDHIASVVNTLFLAYAGASIAVLLLFSTSGLGVAEILNSEQLAGEIIKTVVGSLGLIAAVPLTTALAATVAVGRDPDAPPVRGHGGHHAPGPSGPLGGAAAAVASDGAGAPGDTAVDELDPEERERRAWEAYLERYGAAHPDVPAAPAAGETSADGQRDGQPGSDPDGPSDTD
ncbi:MAG: YibE/F family protein [Nitriliruptoraceae bacterium]|nr:YibE/F family protein [Nitriliruptoraceae bacterium]